MRVPCRVEGVLPTAAPPTGEMSPATGEGDDIAPMGEMIPVEEEEPAPEVEEAPCRDCCRIMGVDVRNGLAFLGLPVQEVEWWRTLFV